MCVCVCVRGVCVFARLTEPALDTNTGLFSPADKPSGEGLSLCEDDGLSASECVSVCV